jgi:hypothetical protein
MRAKSGFLNPRFKAIYICCAPIFLRFISLAKTLGVNCTLALLAQTVGIIFSLSTNSVEI